MADITKKPNPPDGWTYEAYLSRGEEWMMDNYDDHKITLSGEEATQFEGQATKAGLTVVIIP